MPFRIIGHPDLEQQVAQVLWADRRQGPVAVAKIRALLESFDEDPGEVEPAPVVRQTWNEGVTLQTKRDERGSLSPVAAKVTIYVYEVWSLRFAVARVEFPEKAVVAAWLMVETQAAAAAGLTSQNLSLALLEQVQELIWPI
jgi:hypothetical protein